MIDKYNNYVIAKKKLEDVKSVYLHFVVYLVVNIIIGIGTYFLFPQSAIWYLFPIIGGVGLLSHYLNVFHPNLIFDKKWERKKIAKLIKKIEKEEHHFNEFFEKSKVE